MPISLTGEIPPERVVASGAGVVRDIGWQNNEGEKA